MSDDGMYETNSRFNKFESSSRNLEMFSHTFEDAKRPLTFSPEETLSKSWSASTSSANRILSESTSNFKNSANNRLKRLRDKIESNKCHNIVTEKLKKYAKNGEIKTSIVPNKLTNQSESKNKSAVQNNETDKKECCTPTNEKTKNLFNSQELSYNKDVTPPTNPVNIYKNLDKWATPPNKSSKMDLANRRLQRLRNFVINSDKANINTLNCSDFTDISNNSMNNPELFNNASGNNMNDSSVSSHISPLLRGTKRSSSTEIIPECSNNKKMLIEPKCDSSFNKTRSMRLVQSVLNKSNGNLTEKGKPVFATPNALKRKVTLSKYNLSATNINKVPTAEDAKIETQHPVMSVAKNEVAKQSVSSGSSASLTETDSEYQQKMKMTAYWITSHHILDNTHYNPYSDSVKLDKSPPVQVAPKSNEINDQIEEMEWTNAEPDEEQPDALEDNKKQGNYDTTQATVNVEINSKPEEHNTSNTVQKDPDKSMDLCIVVDTNIFIKNLSKLKDILDMKIQSPAKPILYIPWMVVTELDYIKDSSCSNQKLKKDVMNSIVFINRSLEQKNERVVAQTVFEVQNQQQLGTSADDKIMSCCFQVKERYESVILLSNDINLKNKAIINGIDTCSSNEVMMKIVNKLNKNFKYQRIYNKMSMMCTSVICESAKQIYGDAYTKMDMLKNPPWSLGECLKRFKKYWNLIFKDKLLKHFTKTLDETMVWLKNHKYVKDDSEEFIKFMKICITLCIFLRDIDVCSVIVQKTLNEITKQE